MHIYMTLYIYYYTVYPMDYPMYSISIRLYCITSYDTATAKYKEYMDILLYG